MMQQFGRFLGIHINEQNRVLFLRLSLGPGEEVCCITTLTEADFEEKICFDLIGVTEGYLRGCPHLLLGPELSCIPWGHLLCLTCPIGSS